jgi:hypothetical protein
MAVKFTFTLDFAGRQRLAFAPNLGFLPHHFYGILCEADKGIYSFILLYYVLRATSSPINSFWQAFCHFIPAIAVEQDVSKNRTLRGN